MEVVGCAGPSALAWSRPPLAAGESTTIDPWDMTTWPARIVLSANLGVADAAVNGMPVADATGPSLLTGSDGETSWLSPGDLRKALDGETVKSASGATVNATAYILDSAFYVFLTRGAEKGGHAATTYVLRYPASLS